MQGKIKNGLFLLLFTTLLLPMLQQQLRIIDSGILYGYIAAPPNTEFSWPSWWDGSYREAMNNELNDFTGFRPDMIRLNNQLEYSLFKKLRAKWIAPGKEGYLFQTVHINAYLGRDFVGRKAITNTLTKYKAICDTLTKLGKTTIMIHAPCKAWYYPEYIAEHSDSKTMTNYEAYAAAADSLGIRQIDLNSWFRTMKASTKVPLFTKQGIHWSVYGAALAADSFAKYIGRERNINVGHPEWNTITYTTHARASDDDLAKTLNLIYPFISEQFAYPDVYYGSDSTITKPRFIFIGDSFFDAWIDNEFMDHAATDWQVWTHFKTVTDQQTPNYGTIRQLGDEWVQSLLKADCVVLMYTSFNMNEFGDEYINRAYDLFYPGKSL